jgi:hypothetical protein
MAAVSKQPIGPHGASIITPRIDMEGTGFNTMADLMIWWHQQHAMRPPQSAIRRLTFLSYFDNN